MSIDFARTLRAYKPAKRLAQRTPRARDDLIDWTKFAGSGPRALMLDTNVYINRGAGRLPEALRQLIDGALLFHCSVALSELAVGVANADPTQSRWSVIRDHYAALFEEIPDSRLFTPDDQIWADAGVIAGTLARTQGFQAHQRKECLNDALIFLTATKAGLPVLTANRDEFDFIQQLTSHGQFIHY